MNGRPALREQGSKWSPELPPAHRSALCQIVLPKNSDAGVIHSVPVKAAGFR